MVKKDTKLACKHCKSTHKDTISNLLKNGWKHCCGEAMHLVETDAAEVNMAMKNINMRYNKIKGRWEVNLNIEPTHNNAAW